MAVDNNKFPTFSELLDTLEVKKEMQFGEIKTIKLKDALTNNPDGDQLIRLVHDSIIDFHRIHNNYEKRKKSGDLENEEQTGNYKKKMEEQYQIIKSYIELTENKKFKNMPTADLVHYVFGEDVLYIDGPEKAGKTTFTLQLRLGLPLGFKESIGKVNVFQGKNLYLEQPYITVAYVLPDSRVQVGEGSSKPEQTFLLGNKCGKIEVIPGRKTMRKGLFARLFGTVGVKVGEMDLLNMINSERNNPVHPKKVYSAMMINIANNDLGDPWEANKKFKMENKNTYELFSGIMKETNNPLKRYNLVKEKGILEDERQHFTNPSSEPYFPNVGEVFYTLREDAMIWALMGVPPAAVFSSGWDPLMLHRFKNKIDKINVELIEPEVRERFIEYRKEYMEHGKKRKLMEALVEYLTTPLMNTIAPFLAVYGIGRGHQYWSKFHLPISNINPIYGEDNKLFYTTITKRLPELFSIMNEAMGKYKRKSFTVSVPDTKEIHLPKKPPKIEPVIHPEYPDINVRSVHMEKIKRELKRVGITIREVVLEELAPIVLEQYVKERKESDKEYTNHLNKGGNPLEDFDKGEAHKIAANFSYAATSQTGYHDLLEENNFGFEEVRKEINGKKVTQHQIVKISGEQYVPSGRSAKPEDAAALVDKVQKHESLAGLKSLRDSLKTPPQTPAIVTQTDNPPLGEVEPEVITDKVQEPITSETTEQFDESWWTSERTNLYYALADPAELMKLANNYELSNGEKQRAIKVSDELYDKFVSVLPCLIRAYYGLSIDDMTVEKVEAPSNLSLDNSKNALKAATKIVDIVIRKTEQNPFYKCFDRVGLEIDAVGTSTDVSGIYSHLLKLKK